MAESSGSGRPVYLGADLGSTNAKATVFDPEGTPLASGSAGYPVIRASPERAEQDANSWWSALDESLASVAAQSDLSSVRAIGLTGQVDTHVIVEENLEPLLPALLWQDVRTSMRAQKLNEALGEDGRRAGWGDPSPLDASNPVVRALWLAEEEPRAWAASRWMLLPKDHLNARLTGVVAADPLGSFKVVDSHGQYVPGVKHAPGLDERLPRLRAPEEALGALRRSWHGIPAGTVVATGTMDAVGNVLGSGLRAPGDTMVVIGTSVIVATVGAAGSSGPGVVSFAPYRGRQVHAGPTQAGGDALRWWANACGHSIDDVLAAAATAPPGSGGVIFAPHLLGERAPLWDGEVRAWFTGLHAGTGLAELSRAVLEGVAYSARELLDAVEVAAGVSTRITLSGGGARSELWGQIMADVSGRRLHRARETDTAVVGAAALASCALRGGDPWTESAALTQDDRVFAPDDGSRQLHDDRFAIYRRTYAALPEVHRLHRALPDAT